MVALQVVVYNSRSQEPKRSFTRFQDKAYGGSLRPDGKLLAAGGETGVVQLFDCASRSVLRQLRGHQKPCHVTRFSPDKVHVLSGGDDVTVSPLQEPPSFPSLRWYVVQTMF